VQLRYGEDGLDGTWVENQIMPSMMPSNALFERDFKLDVTDEQALKKMFTLDVVKEIQGNSNSMKEVLKDICANVLD